MKIKCLISLCFLCFFLGACESSDKLPNKENSESTHEHTFNIDVWEYDTEWHWHPSNCGHAATTNPIRHIFSNVVTPPSYTAGGYTTHTCTVCGYSYTDSETDPLTHTYESGWHHDESTHWHACTDGGFEHLKSGEASHTFNDVVTPPSYTAGGYTTHTCTVCGYSYTDNYSFTITWKNWDGTVLTTMVVEEGEMPVYDGEKPNKESTTEYCYTFKGWSPEITTATENATYVATYNELEKWDGSYIQPSQLISVDSVYYYCINNAKELAFLSYANGDWLSYNYILTNDIILNDFILEYDENGLITSDVSNLHQWKMINNLSGAILGDGHYIYGLYINDNGDQSFINTISTDLEGLNFANSYVRSINGSCAGICLNSSGKTIRNCSFSGCVSVLRM